MLILRSKLSLMRSSIHSFISGPLGLVAAISMSYDSIYEDGIRIKSKVINGAS